MTSALLRRIVLGFTTLLLLTLTGWSAAPAATASVDPDVDAARTAYLSAVADDVAAAGVLEQAATARTTARDNVASALSTLQNATAAYLADPNPSTWNARYTANYQLGEAKMAYSEARTAYANAKATRDSTLVARRAALDAYRAALAGTG